MLRNPTKYVVKANRNESELTNLSYRIAMRNEESEIIFDNCLIRKRELPLLTSALKQNVRVLTLKGKLLFTYPESKNNLTEYFERLLRNFFQTAITKLDVLDLSELASENGWSAKSLLSFLTNALNHPYPELKTLSLSRELLGVDDEELKLIIEYTQNNVPFNPSRAGSEFLDFINALKKQTKLMNVTVKDNEGLSQFLMSLLPEQNQLNNNNNNNNFIVPFQPVPQMAFEPIPVLHSPLQPIMPTNPLLSFNNYAIPFQPIPQIAVAPMPVQPIFPNIIPLTNNNNNQQNAQLHPASDIVNAPKLIRDKAKQDFSEFKESGKEDCIEHARELGKKAAIDLSASLARNPDLEVSLDVIYEREILKLRNKYSSAISTSATAPNVYHLSEQEREERRLERVEMVVAGYWRENTNKTDAYKVKLDENLLDAYIDGMLSVHKNLKFNTIHDTELKKRKQPNGDGKLCTFNSSKDCQGKKVKKNQNDSTNENVDSDPDMEAPYVPSIPPARQNRSSVFLSSLPVFAPNRGIRNAVHVEANALKFTTLSQEQLDIAKKVYKPLIDQEVGNQIVRLDRKITDPKTKNTFKISFNEAKSIIEELLPNKAVKVELLAEPHEKGERPRFSTEQFRLNIEAKPRLKPSI